MTTTRAYFAPRLWLHKRSGWNERSRNGESGEHAQRRQLRPRGSGDGGGRTKVIGQTTGAGTDGVTAREEREAGKGTTTKVTRTRGLRGVSGDTDTDTGRGLGRLTRRGREAVDVTRGQGGQGHGIPIDIQEATRMKRTENVGDIGVTGNAVVPLTKAATRKKVTDGRGESSVRIVPLVVDTPTLHLPLAVRCP